MLSAPGEEFIEARAALHAWANFFARAQQAMDSKALDCARELQKLDGIGYSLDANAWVTRTDNADGDVIPLLSMIAHRRYLLDALRIELAVIPEPGVALDAIAPETRLRLVGLDSAEDGACQALITLRRAKGIVAELEVAGRTAASVAHDEGGP